MRIFPGEWWENKGERQERLWKKKNAAVATIKQKSVQKRNTKTYLSQQEPQLDKARALDVQLVENRKQLAESQKEAALALQAKDNLHQSVC